MEEEDVQRSGREQDSDGADEKEQVEEHVFEEYREFIDAFIVFALTAVSVVSAHFFPLGIGSVVSLDFTSLASYSSISALFFVVPVVYTVYTSLDSFSFSSLASLIGVSGFLLGPVPGAVGSSVALSCLFVSWSTGKNFTGENYFSVFSSGGGSFMTFFSVVLAASLAFSLVYVPENSSGFRSSVVSHLSSTAENIASETVGGLQGTQEERAVELSGQLGRTAAVLAIEETRKDVLGTVESSGLFDQEQKSVLEIAFSDSMNTVPETVSQNMSDIASEQVSGGVVTNQTVESSVQPVVEDMVSQGFERKKLVFAGLFLLIFPILMVLKLPFKLLSALYGRFVVFLFDRE